MSKPPSPPAKVGMEIDMKNPAAVALGTLGGKVKSEAKAKSSAANAKLGGRPAKQGAPGMKISYQPTGINNFHGRAAINLIITGDKTYGMHDCDVYRISKGQAKRLEDHFCGITDCRCPHGAVEQLNESGTEWGIRVDWCSL